MSDDNEIIDAIHAASWIGYDAYDRPHREPAHVVLDKLRTAGYDIAPAHTIRLGQAVEACAAAPDLIRAFGLGWESALRAIYNHAGIEQGGE